MVSGRQSVNLTLNCEKWSADGSVKMPACSKTAVIKQALQLAIKISKSGSNSEHTWVVDRLPRSICSRSIIDLYWPYGWGGLPSGFVVCQLPLNG